jgi:hypothetical protein
MATIPSWQEQQLPLGQRQRCLGIDGNNASLTTSNEGNNMDDDNAIAMRAAMPAWGQWQHHCNKGNNAFADQGQQRHCYEPYYGTWDMCTKARYKDQYVQGT